MEPGVRLKLQGRFSETSISCQSSVSLINVFVCVHMCVFLSVCVCYHFGFLETPFVGFKHLESEKG